MARLIDQLVHAHHAIGVHRGQAHTTGHQIQARLDKPFAELQLKLRHGARAKAATEALVGILLAPNGSAASTSQKLAHWLQANDTVMRSMSAQLRESVQSVLSRQTQATQLDQNADLARLALLEVLNQRGAATSPTAQQAIDVLAKRADRGGAGAEEMLRLVEDVAHDLRSVPAQHAAAELRTALHHHTSTLARADAVAHWLTHHGPTRAKSLSAINALVLLEHHLSSADEQHRNDELARERVRAFFADSSAPIG